MAKDEQLTLTKKDQENLETIRVEMGFSSINEAAQYLIRRALDKRAALFAGRNSRTKSKSAPILSVVSQERD